MMFKFHEDEQVMLNCAERVNLPMGSIGTVFCLYETDPVAYEVNFQAADGRNYASIVNEADLTAVRESVPMSAAGVAL
jgi:hypothetical protein